MASSSSKNSKRGRQRVEMKMIEKKGHRQASFSKRRKGLFKKVQEISKLCGATVAAVVESEAGRVYTCGDVLGVFDKYLAGSGEEEEMKTLEDGKDSPSDRKGKKKVEHDDELWWEKPMDQLIADAHEKYKSNVGGRGVGKKEIAQLLVELLELLMNNVGAKILEKRKNKASSSSSPWDDVWSQNMEATNQELTLPMDSDYNQGTVCVMELEEEYSTDQLFDYPQQDAEKNQGGMNHVELEDDQVGTAQLFQGLQFPANDSNNMVNVVELEDEFNSDQELMNSASFLPMNTPNYNQESNMDQLFVGGLQFNGNDLNNMVADLEDELYSDQTEELMNSSSFLPMNTANDNQGSNIHQLFDGGPQINANDSNTMVFELEDGFNIHQPEELMPMPAATTNYNHGIVNMVEENNNMYQLFDELQNNVNYVVDQPFDQLQFNGNYPIDVVNEVELEDGFNQLVDQPFDELQFRGNHPTDIVNEVGLEDGFNQLVNQLEQENREDPVFDGMQFNAVDLNNIATEVGLELEYGFNVDQIVEPMPVDLNVVEENNMNQLVGGLQNGADYNQELMPMPMPMPKDSNVIEENNAVQLIGELQRGATDNQVMNHFNLEDEFDIAPYLNFDNVEGVYEDEFDVDRYINFDNDEGVYGLSFLDGEP